MFLGGGQPYADVQQRLGRQLKQTSPGGSPPPTGEQEAPPQAQGSNPTKWGVPQRDAVEGEGAASGEAPGQDSRQQKSNGKGRRSGGRLQKITAHRRLLASGPHVTSGPMSLEGFTLSCYSRFIILQCVARNRDVFFLFEGASDLDFWRFV